VTVFCEFTTSDVHVSWSFYSNLDPISLDCPDDDFDVTGNPDSFAKFPRKY